MGHAYPITLTPDEDGRVVVTFPDVKGASTDGADEAEAIANAADSLIAALIVHMTLRAANSAPEPCSQAPDRYRPPTRGGEASALLRDARTEGHERRSRSPNAQIRVRGAAIAGPRSPLRYRPDRGGAHRAGQAAGDPGARRGVVAPAHLRPSRHQPRGGGRSASFGSAAPDDDRNRPGTRPEPCPMQRGLLQQLFPDRGVLLLLRSRVPPASVPERPQSNENQVSNWRSRVTRD